MCNIGHTHTLLGTLVRVLGSSRNLTNVCVFILPRVLVTIFVHLIRWKYALSSVLAGAMLLLVLKVGDAEHDSINGCGFLLADLENRMAQVLA